MNESQAKAETEPLAAGSALRVVTGARLHFGLLDSVAPFGGVGAMVEQPTTEITVRPSGAFHCDDVYGPRIRPIAARISELTGASDLPPCRIDVAKRPHAHSGLGSGTQLALAVAETIGRFVGYHPAPTELACEIAGRGVRSAVGVHGYFCGGLIFETAQEPVPLNPVRERVDVPGQWRVALFRPAEQVGSVSGQMEREQFSKLATTTNAARSDELHRLAGDEILPAARDAQFERFARAVTQYNRESGMLFEPVQGGPYNGPAVTELIGRLVHGGARGVGQSSWGPTVFSWFESADEADRFVESLPDEIPTPTITRPRFRGREFFLET